MSEKTLEIFKPLKTYFAILCENECDNNYSNCKELIDKLASKNCDPSQGLSENFKNALSWFASELKKADSPIGLYTIKNKLLEIFQNANKSNFVDSVISAVNGSKDLSGFKMDQENGEGKTYENILRSVYDNSKNPNQIFNEWFRSSFDTYKPNQDYFKDKVKPMLNELDGCELKLLNDFFEVAVEGEADKVSIDEYILKMNTDFEGKQARLNVKIEKGQTKGLSRKTNSDKPKLLQLLPDSVKEAFEEYLITPPEKGNMVLYERPGCYKLKISKEEPKKETYQVPNPKVILDWFRVESGKINKTIKKSSEPEVKDAVDNVPYIDNDNDNTEFMFPDSFKIVNYRDNWRADLNGDLWKKNPSSGEFVKYTDADFEADSKSFADKQGNCGNLCIFNDGEKCKKFFEKMMNKGELQIKELNDTINSNNFVQSYKELQKNIVNVNPLFVIGTLRMFGFEKYEELNNDGTKTVKIESFTRWWSRYSNKLELNPKSPFPGSHKGLDPEPPANLELFFKLLIAFINNNEFVLNPQNKQLINKLGKPKVSLYGKPKEYFMINGERVPNKYYNKEVAIQQGKDLSTEQPESLSNLVEMMRKNASLGARPVNMGLPENRANLNTLLNLMVGVTNGGKLRISTMSPFSTGKGYIVGGGDSDSNLLPCSKNALEIYKIGIDALKKKNKSLSESENNELVKQLDTLSELEKEVYDKLYVLANYIKVINVMDDKAQNNNVTIQIMDDAIKEYESKSSKLSTTADSTISMLLKKLSGESFSSYSGYGKLY